MKRNGRFMIYLGLAIVAAGIGVGELFVSGSTEIGFGLLLGAIGTLIWVYRDRQSSARARAAQQRAGQAVDQPDPRTQWIIGASSALLLGIYLLAVSDDNLRGLALGLDKIGGVILVAGICLWAAGDSRNPGKGKDKK